MATKDSEREINTGGGALVKGDVYTGGAPFIGRDEINNFLIQVYEPQVPDAPEEYRSFTDDRPRPYRPDEPLGPLDKDWLFGRESESARIVRWLGERQAVALYGPASVGKSSLLAAGVIPRLKEHGARVVHLRDYAHPVGLIRAELIYKAQKAGHPVDAGLALPDLLKSIVSHTETGVVLVLDQFERYFAADGPTYERHLLRQDLTSAIALLAPRNLKFLFAIRDDLQSELDQAWGDLLPDLRRSPVHVGPLTRKLARQAIEEPLARDDHPATFSDDVVEARLLPDLDRLSEVRDQIWPAELQIVCHELYEAALDTPQRHMNVQLYLAISDGKGAERIVNRRFERLLARLPDNARAKAGRIAQEMLDPELDTWVDPDQLEMPDLSPAGKAEVMEAMAQVGILMWHTVDGRRVYAFSGNSVAQAARRLYGEEAQRRHQARNEQTYAWRAWLTYDALARRSQLHYLQRHGTRQSYPPLQGLLLLRSAVAHRMPTGVWLDRLASPETLELLRYFEDRNEDQEEPAPPGPGDKGEFSESRFSDTDLDHARLLLSLSAGEMPDRPASADFGSLSWTAAAHTESLDRETAAHALWLVHRSAATERLRAAVKAGRLSRWRMAEMRAVLAENDPAISEENSERPVLERAGIWWWGFRRRFIRNARRIGSLWLGGAIGAGLALALLRAFLAEFAGEPGGVNFYRYFPAGFLLGGGVALGIALAGVLWMLPAKDDESEGRVRQGWREVALGVAGFGLFHLFIVVILDASAVVGAPLVLPSSLLAGLGLTLAVRDQPLAGWRLGPGRWLVRLGLAAVVFLLAQAVFLPALRLGTALVFGWDGFFYESRLADNLMRWGLQAILDIPGWHHIAGLIDAALTGILMTVGLTAGLVLGDRAYRRWEDLVTRATP